VSNDTVKGVWKTVNIRNRWILCSWTEPICKKCYIINNYELPAELFITHFMTNAERLNDMNRPAEEEAIKFLSGQPLVPSWL
jgi:hypothetical protein